MGNLGLQRSERRGLSSFLADHEVCDEGFEIQRQEGPEGAMVRVICNGCGEAIEYPAASSAGSQDGAPVSNLANSERRAERRRFRPAEPGSARPVPGTPAGIGPEPVLEPAGASAPPPGIPDEGRTSALPGWLSTALIAVLIGGGLLMVILGVFSSTDDGPGPPERAPVAQPGNGAAAQWQTAPPTTASTKGAAEALSPGDLPRRRFADRISIGVPKRWEAGVSGGAVTVSSRDGDSQVKVFYEAGARPEGEIARQTREFLRQRHPGARLHGPNPSRLGDTRAQLVRALYAGGSESAWAFTSGGYTYLVLERVSRTASAATQRRADATVASIRPL